jgi:hypothetical protein
VAFYGGLVGSQRQIVTRCQLVTFLSLVLNVFGQDPYWLVAQHLDGIAPHDLTKLVDVLSEWGWRGCGSCGTRTWAPAVSGRLRATCDNARNA